MTFFAAFAVEQAVGVAYHKSVEYSPNRYQSGSIPPMQFDFGDKPDACSNVAIQVFFQGDIDQVGNNNEYVDVMLGGQKLFTLGHAAEGSFCTAHEQKTTSIDQNTYNKNHLVKIVLNHTPDVHCATMAEVRISYSACGGVEGDPHITTWKKEHFEYHGQCDLTMVKDPEFANGLGLDVQVRTKIVRFWAYNKNVAIKIGNDILEIEGSPDDNDAEAHYWINFEYQGELDTFAGFPVTQEAPSVYKRQYKIDLSSKYPGASIVVQHYKEFIKVHFDGDEQVFGNTVGLLGDYKTGKTLARDGVTVMNDFTEFGDEWQVIPSEPKLFHEVAHPQFPELCIKPEDPRGERKRRLDESTVSIEQAETACASLKDTLSIKDCVYDIMATQDLGMVGAF